MSDSDLKEYLKVVLTHLRLVKLLSSNPSPQDVLELQEIDWLLQETEERIQGIDKLEECDSNARHLKHPPKLPDRFKQIRKAWLVQIKQTWVIISRGGRTVAAFPTREDALVWWSLVTAEEPGKTRPILMDKNTLSANQESRIAQASTTTKPTPHSNIKRQLPRAAATAPNSAETSKPKPRTAPKRKKKKKAKIKWPSSKTSLRDRMLSTTKHSNIRRPWQG